MLFAIKLQALRQVLPKRSCLRCFRPMACGNTATQASMLFLARPVCMHADVQLDPVFYRSQARNLSWYAASASCRPVTAQLLGHPRRSVLLSGWLGASCDRSSQGQCGLRGTGHWLLRTLLVLLRVSRFQHVHIALWDHIR
jgi:hypothetical protein